MLLVIAGLAAGAAYADTQWTWSLDGETFTGGMGTFTACESVSHTALGGTYARDDSGLLKLSKTSCATCTDAGCSTGCASNSGECAGVPATLYAIESPGSHLIVQPTLGGPTVETQPIYNIPAGNCPSSDVVTSFIFAQWTSRNDVTSSNQIGAGTFSWTTAGDATVSGGYNITQFQPIPGFGFTLPNSGCSGGLIPVTGPAGTDRQGTLYISSTGEFLFKTSANHAIFAVPQIRIRDAKALAGRYAGFSFGADGTNSVLPVVNMDIDAAVTSCSGYALTNDAPNLSLPQSLTISAINSPVDGMLTGTISHGGTARNMLCVVSSSSDLHQNLFCAGQTPELPSQPYSVLLTSARGRPGTPDTHSGFGTNGEVIFPPGPERDEAFTVGVQADGKLIVGGATMAGGKKTAQVMRLNIDGTLDTTFNSTGAATVRFGSSQDIFNSLYIYPTGNILVGGNASYDMGLARFTTDGALDTTFNGTGTLTIDFGLADTIYALSVQPDGKIVGSGIAQLGGDLKGALVRYLSDGTPDSTFNGNGKKMFSWGPAEDEGWTVKAQPDGKIVVGGYSYNGSDQDFAVSRFTSTGELDTTFNGTGNLLLFPNHPGQDIFYGSELQPDGKIVLGGPMATATSSAFAVMRLNSDGSLDTSFGGTGLKTIDFQGAYSENYVIALQEDRKILTAGMSGDTRLDFAIARLTSSGELDPTFNSTGTFTRNLGTSDSWVNWIALHPMGKILLGGAAFDSNGISSFSLLRIWR